MQEPTTVVTQKQKNEKSTIQKLKARNTGGVLTPMIGSSVRTFMAEVVNPRKLFGRFLWGWSALALNTVFSVSRAFYNAESLAECFQNCFFFLIKNLNQQINATRDHIIAILSINWWFVGDKAVLKTYGSAICTRSQAAYGVSGPHMHPFG